MAPWTGPKSSPKADHLSQDNSSVSDPTDFPSQLHCMTLWLYDRGVCLGHLHQNMIKWQAHPNPPHQWSPSKDVASHRVGKRGWLRPGAMNSIAWFRLNQTHGPKSHSTTHTKPKPPNEGRRSADLSWCKPQRQFYCFVVKWQPLRCASKLSKISLALLRVWWKLATYKKNAKAHLFLRTLPNPNTRTAFRTRSSSLPSHCRTNIRPPDFSS